MSIQLNGNHEITEFTATEITQIQNAEMAEVFYQSDQAEDTWARMDIGDGIKIDTGMVFYFKSLAKGKLSTVKLFVP